MAKDETSSEPQPPRAEGTTSSEPQPPRAEGTTSSGPQLRQAKGTAPGSAYSKQEELELTKEVQRYGEDIRRMLAYCRDQGVQVPETIKPDAGIMFPMAQKVAPDKATLQALVRTHGQLSALVKKKNGPTPRSLAATDFSWTHIWHDSRPWWTLALLFFLLAMAAIGLMMYAWASPELGQGADSTPEVAKPAPQDYLFAAMLGAALNGLFTIQVYIRDRTFEPRYTWIYVIRFTVGVIAGVALASCGYGLFKDDPTFSQLGPAAIALLGGYSAEAVRQILDRLVEVLLTVVRGRETGSPPAGGTSASETAGLQAVGAGGGQ